MENSKSSPTQAEIIASRGNIMNNTVLQYGRSESARINHLLSVSTEEEKIKLAHSIETYASTVGAQFNTGEAAIQAGERNRAALLEIDKFFIRKFSMHVVGTRHQLEITEDEWVSMLQEFSIK